MIYLERGINEDVRMLVFCRIPKVCKNKILLLLGLEVATFSILLWSTNS